MTGTGDGRVRREKTVPHGEESDVGASRGDGFAGRPVGGRQTECSGVKVDSHWRPAVRSPAQYGPGTLVSPSGTDRKLLNGPGSDVN